VRDWHENKKNKKRSLIVEGRAVLTPMLGWQWVAFCLRGAEKRITGTTQGEEGASFHRVA